MTATRSGMLAERLRGLRLSRGYAKARHFARELGISENRYTRYERGEAEPDVELMRMICDKLGATPNDLFGWAQNAASPSYPVAEPTALAGFAEETAAASVPHASRTVRERADTDVTPGRLPGAAGVAAGAGSHAASLELAAWRLASAFGAVGICVANPTGAPTGVDGRLSALQATAEVFLRLREEPLATVAQLLQSLDVSSLDQERQSALSGEIEAFVRELRRGG